MQLSSTETKEIKKFYENNIEQSISSALGIETKNIIVNWNFDEVKVRIDVTANDNVTIYTFVFTEEKVNLTLESYKVLFNTIGNQKYISGIQAKEASIDYTTFTAIKQMIESELNKPYEVVEEINICDETAE